jgi:hypothetical protein
MGCSQRDEPAAGQPLLFHQISYRRGTVYSARMSSDGKTIVYSAAWDGKPHSDLCCQQRISLNRALWTSSKLILLSVSSSGQLAILTGAKPLDHFRIWARWLPCPSAAARLGKFSRM